MSFVAFDSFGVKSMCTRIETDDCVITLDPGIAAEVGSFPLPAMMRRLLALEYKERIRESTNTSDIIVLTHYHYDHHIKERDDKLHKDKILLVKDPTNFINRSQRERAALFFEVTKGLPKKVEIADGREFRFGDTRIRFSNPMWHGVVGTNLGYIIAVEISDGQERLTFTSDVQGPALEDHVNFIVKSNPDILIVDGPATYLLGYIMAYYNLARCILNFVSVLKRTDPHLVIFDHHLMRDYRYPDLMYLAYEKARELGKNVQTAAEFLGREVKVLEGYRKHGPTRWKSWKRFERKDVETVLKNAVEAGLIEKAWLSRLSAI